MNLYPIPYDFIDKKIQLSWCDIQWGYENNLITSDVPIKKAETMVSTGSYTKSELELSFAMLSEAKNVSSFLKELCSKAEQKDEFMAQKKWLFIVLSWLWTNRDSFEDPLAEVEIIYADFDYPSEIEGFIKYMPPTDDYDPSAHTQMENIDRLMYKWSNYLEKEFLTYKS